MGTRLDSAKNKARILAIELELARKLCESIGTVRALTVSLLLKYGEYSQLVDLKVDPLHYDNHGLFADDYLVTSVLQKNPRLPLDIDRKQEAIGKFMLSEKKCKETNARFLRIYDDPSSLDPEDLKLLLAIQLKIQEILRPFPNRRDLDFAEKSMRFGPGATTSLSGVVTQGKKYSLRELDCTSDLVSFRAFCFPDLWKQNAPSLNVRDSSKLTTVPKNAKTDRVICIEPDLNIFVQLGIGALIRKKLLLNGLDLSTQETNQALAQLAHELDLSTVDLKAASDTISSEVVSFLLPPAWVDLLSYPRVRSTTLPNGEVANLEKWSSMGNGYTFELETLIFYAVLLTVVPPEEHCLVTAYGDDCILPTRYYDRFARALDLLGFEVNRDKTFGKGRFHESCGADFFDGQNVRPFFLRAKDENLDFNSVCYLYANNARRWAHRRNGSDSCDSRCLPFWLCCFAAVDPAHRYHIPVGYGDSGFISDFDRAKPARASRDGWGGFRFKYWKVPSVMRTVCSNGAYISFLNGNISDFSRGTESLRGRTHYGRTGLGYVLTWPNLGPWV